MRISKTFLEPKINYHVLKSSHWVILSQISSVYILMHFLFNTCFHIICVSTPQPHKWSVPISFFLCTTWFTSCILDFICNNICGTLVAKCFLYIIVMDSDFLCFLRSKFIWIVRHEIWGSHLGECEGTVFWDVTLHSLVDMCSCFEGTCCLKSEFCPNCTAYTTKFC